MVRAMQKIALALVFLLSLVTLVASQAPPPVPALPDAPRLTSFNLTSSNCACSVGFAIYGDGTDVDQWVDVFVNGISYPSTDPTHGWSLSSVTGPLGSIARPITNAVLTFAQPQTGLVNIVGARRPRRLSQFPESRGVTARDLNQVITDIIATQRENWDEVDTAIRGQPGEVFAPLPNAAARAGQALIFDQAGQPAVGAGGGGGGGGGTTTLTGDVLGGPASGTIPTTLSATSVVAGSYGSATQVPQLTVDSKGRLTLASNQAISATGIGAVPTARQIILGAGLAGGGALTADVSIAFAPIASNNLLANITGGSLAPSGTTLSALIDSAIGNAQGNILYRSAANWVVLPPGTNGQLLASGGPGGNVSWSTASGTGSVTSVGAGAGIITTPSPITGAGTVSIAAPVTVPLGGTGNTTLTNNALLIGKGAAATGDIGTGAAGQCVTSNGAGNAPTFQSGCRAFLGTLTAANSATLSVCASGCGVTANFATFNDIELVFENILPATASVDCHLTIQSGGVFRTTGYHGRAVTQTAGAGDQTTFVPCSDPSTAIGGPGNGAGTSGTLRLLGAATAFPQFVGGFFYLSNTSVPVAASVGSVWWNAGTGGAVTGIQVQMQTGNIQSGIIKVYGAQ